MLSPAATLNPLALAAKAAPAPTKTMDRAVADLAKRSREGSLEAFEELVAKYEARIYGFLCRHIGNAHDAQDLTQETFVRAWRAIGRYDPTRDFATWIFTIARRVAANHFRSRKTHDELSEDLPGVAEEAGAGDSAQALWRVAKKLKPSQYEALWLHYAEDFSVAETARVMGLTTIHVKVILHRARKELARHIKPDTL